MENNLSNIADSDLCSTCNHETGCMYRQNYKGKVIFCEEFEIEDIIEGSQYVEIQNDNNKINSENYTGLCRNCDLRKTCMLCTPAKIIWHCEEYQ